MNITVEWKKFVTSYTWFSMHVIASSTLQFMGPGLYYLRCTNKYLMQKASLCLVLVLLVITLLPMLESKDT